MKNILLEDIVDELGYKMPENFPFLTYQEHYGPLLRAWAHACAELEAARDLAGLEWLSFHASLLTLDSLAKMLDSQNQTKHQE